jgi:hypothetical protein
VALIADPFGDYEPATLEAAFDRVIPFKQHYVIDTTAVRSESAHHVYYARRALRSLKVSIIPLEDYLDDWSTLYATLVARHAIAEGRRFSRASIARQARVPGLVTFAARKDDAIVGMSLWFVQNAVAYNHLAAMNEEGYALGASYALYARAIDFFLPQVKWIDLGGAAGLTPESDDGLAKFKRGWANGTRPAYFCGRICDREAYESLASFNESQESSFFPSYRSEEAQ